VCTWISQGFLAKKLFLFFKNNFKRNNHCKFIHHKSYLKPFLSCYLPCIVCSEYFSIIFSVKMCTLYFIKYQVCLVLAFCLCGTLASFCRKINFYSLSPSNPRQLHQPTITLAVISLLSLCLIRLLFKGFFQVISFQDLPTLFFLSFSSLYFLPQLVPKSGSGIDQTAPRLSTWWQSVQRHSAKRPLESCVSEFIYAWCCGINGILCSGFNCYAQEDSQNNLKFNVAFCS